MKRISLLTLIGIYFLGSIVCIPEVGVSDFEGSFWFLQVYEGSCPNCASGQKQLQHVSTLMKGIAKVGKANAKNIGGITLKSNPSYYLLRADLSDYVEYKQKISKISISKFILAQMQNTVKSRHTKLFGKADDSSSEPKKEKKPSKDSGDKKHKKQNGVIVLNDQNFEQTVLQSDEAWFVEFYSPSCGHCRSLQPQYDKLPAKIGKRVNIAKIDATQNRQMAQKFQIKGFPTLFFFQLNDKQKPAQYQGERTAEAMSAWLESQKIGQQKLEFTKLTKQLYNKECNRNIVCLIFILEGKSQLKNQMGFIEDVMEEQKGKPLRFFYSPRLSQFQSKLMIQDRQTPTLVSVWDSINSYKIYNGKQNAEELNSYIGKIMERRSWIKMDGKIVNQLFATNEQL